MNNEGNQVEISHSMYEELKAAYKDRCFMCLLNVNSQPHVIILHENISIDEIN